MTRIQFTCAIGILLIASMPQAAEYTVRDMQNDVLRDFAFRDRPIHPKVFEEFGGWISDPPETNVVLAVDLTSVYEATNEFSPDEVSVDGDVVTVVDDDATHSYKVVDRHGDEVTVIYRENAGGSLTTAAIFRLAIIPSTIIKNGAVRDTLRLELRETIDAPEAVARFLSHGSPQAEGQIGLTIGADEAYRAADAMLNRVYSDLRESLEDDSATWAMVRDAQRAWLAFRDVWAELESKPFAEGSLYSSYKLGVLKRLTDEQTVHLKRLWLDGYPGDGER